MEFNFYKIKNMDENIYISLAKNNKKHWWYKSRRKILYKILKKETKNLKDLKILDFGAGVGENLLTLSKFGYVEAYEKDENTKHFLQNYFKSHQKIKVVDKITQNYDLIFLTDVIEHIDNDEEIVKELIKYLNNDGQIIVTVPAFQFLYSKKDESSHHFRRYNYNSLKKLFENKIKIKKISYFNFFLFLPICFFIILFKMLKIQFVYSVLKTPNFFLNLILYKIFSFERFFLNKFNFPFGVSLILIGEKEK